MSEIKGKAWNYIMKNGPSPYSDFETSITNIQKSGGLTKFGPRIHSSTQNKRPEAIYYIEGLHTPKEVLDKWLDHNPAVLDVNKQKLLYEIADYGNEFKEVAQDSIQFPRSTETLSNNPLGAPRGYTVGSTCPMCNKELDCYLPTHLPNCDNN